MLSDDAEAAQKKKPIFFQTPIQLGFCMRFRLCQSEVATQDSIDKRETRWDGSHSSELKQLVLPVALSANTPMQARGFGGFLWHLNRDHNSPPLILQKKAAPVTPSPRKSYYRALPWSEKSSGFQITGQFVIFISNCIYEASFNQGTIDVLLGSSPA